MLLIALLFIIVLNGVELCAFSATFKLIQRFENIILKNTRKEIKQTTSKGKFYTKSVGGQWEYERCIYPS